MQGKIRWTAALAWAALCSLASATDFYVSPSGNDTDDGLTPGTAFNTIQRGVDAAFSLGDQVLVADGVYAGPGNVAINFSGKPITVKSISGNPQACIIDAGGTTVGVLFVSFETADSVLDGFTVRNGAAGAFFEGFNAAQGGAIRIAGQLFSGISSPTIRNCIIRDSTAVGGTSFFGPGAGRGGGVYAEFSTASFENCVFVNNSAFGFGGTNAGDSGVGTGGAAAGYQVALTFRGCRFENNTAAGGNFGLGSQDSIGGAIYLDFGSAFFESCYFAGNAAKRGGGAFLVNGFAEVYNTAFVKNTATDGEAGGMALVGSPFILSNSTFAANSAFTNGGGLYLESGSDGTVANSILWANSAAGGSPQLHVAVSGTPAVDVRNSLIQGSIVLGVWSLPLTTDLGGNVDSDPLFKLNPSGSSNGDLSLKSASPARDAGDNAFASPYSSFDLAGNDRIIDGTVDMGAYEFNVDPLELTLALQAEVQAMITNGEINPLLGVLLRVPLDLAVANLQNSNSDAAIRNLRQFIALTAVYQLFGVLTPAEGADLRADAQEIIDLLTP